MSKTSPLRRSCEAATRLRSCPVKGPFTLTAAGCLQDSGFVSRLYETTVQRGPVARLTYTHFRMLRNSEGSEDGILLLEQV